MQEQDLVELELEIEEAQARVRSLCSLRLLLRQRLGLRDQRGGITPKAKAEPGPARSPEPAPANNGKHPGGKPPSEETVIRRRNAAIFLYRNGPATAPEIVREIKCPEGSIYYVLNHEWFEKLPTGRYKLSDAAGDALDRDED